MPGYFDCRSTNAWGFVTNRVIITQLWLGLRRIYYGMFTTTDIFLAPVDEPTRVGGVGWAVQTVITIDPDYPVYGD